MLANTGQVVLQPIDWAAIAAYFLVLIAIGWGFRKQAGGDLSHFFLAGRRLPGWMNGVANASTCLNADVAPAYCGMTVVTGLFVCWWYISRFGLSLMIAGVLFAVYWRRLRILTSPQFYELRFSGRAALAMRLLVALRGAGVGVVMWIGAGLLGLTKITEALLGWSKWESLVLVVPVMMFYVFLSGYLGVVLTDLLQGAIIIGSALVLLVAVWMDFGGPVGLAEALTNTWGAEVLSWHPPLHNEMLGLLGVVAWMVGSTVGYGGDLASESQRVLSCRNAREAARMYVWTQVVLFVMLAVLTLPALGAMVRWPGLRNDTINRELAFGLLLGRYLPPGLLGLALVGTLAALMSTVDGHLSFAGQVFATDVYQRVIRPSASTAQCLLAGKLAMGVVMGLALIVATVAVNVIDISIFMLGLAAAEWTANWGQWWWWRFNGAARLTASLGGPLIYLFNKFIVFGKWFEVGPAAAYVVVLTSLAATCALWIAVALVTPPDPAETLVEFYRQCRPLGWWGPVAEQAGLPHRGFGPVFRGLALAALGALAIAAGTIAFSCLYVARWEVAAGATLVAAVAGWCFRTRFGVWLADLDDVRENGPPESVTAR